MKILLVCSRGGHLFQLYLLKEFWKDYDRLWVTSSGCDSRVLLKDEPVCYAHFPTNRNIVNFVRNLFLAFRILKKEKPDFVVSTGAGVAVPFIYAAKALKIKTVYLECLGQAKRLSLSGRLVYPLVDRLIVQWPSLAEKYNKAEFAGQII